MLDYIACIIVRGLNIILRFVPISISLWIGRRIGSAAFFFNKKRRVIAYANLKAAFAPEKSPPELRGITKRVYQNMAQTFMEVLNLTKINKKYVDEYIEVLNFDRLCESSKSGRGTILLTAHFGDWELSSLVSSVLGFPIMVLAREQKMKRLNELLNRLRESNGCKVIRKGASTKYLFRALYDKKVIGILSDQDAGRNGMFVDFFGRPTSCHTGPMEMAKRTDSLIIPNFNVRVNGPYHKVYLEQYIDFRGSKSEDDIRINLQKFAKILESYIRKYPDQWLWLHKRWKSTPARTILILNDGKAGHLNQSMAVARQIQAARTTQDRSLDDTKIVIVDIKFKNRLARTLLSMCATFSNWRCHGCMKCMKLCLEKSSYDNLMQTYSDFVISCGSASAAPNIFMSYENNARNIAVMRPDIILGKNKYDLLVIPKHDNPSMAKNIVVTEAAPNMIDERMLAECGERLRQHTGIKGDKLVGVLIGGDNPEFTMSKELIERVISAVSEFCRENDAEYIVTTSRRTPPVIEEMLNKRAKGDARCRLLVIANESNPEWTVAGILGLSRLVIVSGESISMVSEAISSLKKVLVFELAKKHKVKAKHEAALRMLEKDGYVTIVEVQRLSSGIKELWFRPGQVKELRDRVKIFDAVRKLI